MNLTIDSKYSTFSISIVFYLLHNNEKYNLLWQENFPDLSNQAKNFFENQNCGCRPPLLQNYLKNRFSVDVFTVNFINENPESIDITSFCEKIGEQNLRGTMFVIENSVSSFKDFMASLQQKRASFSNFNAINIEDKIVVTFF